MTYCDSLYRYRRRPSRVVRVGDVAVGGDHPIRVQSMITCDTMDTAASIRQVIELADVGCEIVRITAPTVKDAANLEHIVAGLRAAGCRVPIVADIHFKPEAALEAAKWVEKVRINPGNFADSKKFAVKEYTDSEYAGEIERIAERFTPLVKFCKEHGRAMRIGTNHGSLSDRIMNRYGDTPLGMVESALEFARIARSCGYHDFMFSMKSSNPKVMIEAYRLLVARLDEEFRISELGFKSSPCGNQNSGDAPASEQIRNQKSEIRNHSWSYPLHLGVTEAGEGEDGRIKSAIGIGSLLSDGVGDTIRVSLTEDSIHEIPVGRALVAHTMRLADMQRAAIPDHAPAWDPFVYSRRESARIETAAAHPMGTNVGIGGGEVIRVAVTPGTHAKLAHKLDRLGDFTPDFVVESDTARPGCGNGGATCEAHSQDEAASAGSRETQPGRAVSLSVAAIDPRDDAAIAALNDANEPRVVTVRDGLDLPVIAAFRLLAARVDPRHPILLKDVLSADSEVRSAQCAVLSEGDDASLSTEHSALNTFLDALVTASTNLGSLLCDGIGDAVLVQGENAPGQSLRLAFNILQAAGARIFKTDYVACPSCGRTLFDLQSTTAQIKSATLHLKGVKIAIMGCIVNGPGEMADADFGYVGGAPGKINLYVGKKPVKFNIPQDEAVARLVDLIREHGKWVDAPVAV